MKSFAILHRRNLAIAPSLQLTQRICFALHIISLVFGLAGLLLVLPHPEFIAQLPKIGQIAFRWAMTGGGAVYMVSGAIAVAIYAYRNLNAWHAISFLIPALGISLGAELLGTSTGFPFGKYHYLTGLGYKIAGLVPFTIPLSWFYLGLSAYLLADAGLKARFNTAKTWLIELGAIVIGSILLMSWDFVLDPAMSQTTMPFWAWDQPGAFFGMPYQNFAGWFGTGVVYMSVATLLWRARPKTWSKLPLALPLGIYLSNFAFAMIISIDGKIYPPIFLGLLLGVVPAIWLYQLANQIPETTPAPLPQIELSESERSPFSRLAVSASKAAE